MPVAGPVAKKRQRPHKSTQRLLMLDVEPEKLIMLLVVGRCLSNSKEFSFAVSLHSLSMFLTANEERPRMGQGRTPLIVSWWRPKDATIPNGMPVSRR